MLKNYLTLAFRSLLRHTLFSFINITGFSVGMACVMLIALYVWDELTFDRYHTQADRIYRVVQDQHFSEGIHQLATTSGPVAAALKNDFSQIQEAVRIFVRKNVLLAKDEKRFYGEDVVFTDPEIFRVFSFRLIKGHPEQALFQPNTIVLTEKTAATYFGTEDPLGKILKLNNTPYTVTGIVAEPPQNSHFHFSCLASIATLTQAAWINNWGISSLWTYVLLKPETDTESFQEELPAFIEKYHGEGYASRISYLLQPLTSIHLYSNLASEIEPNGDSVSVNIFITIALFILLLACINYVNLSTARSTERMKEVGMRKTLGAYRKQIAGQFLLESVVTALLALIAALFLVAICLPAFNQLTGKGFNWYLLEWHLLLYGCIFFLLIGLASGAYPAWYLSGFRPVQVLKGTISFTNSPIHFRKILVVVQFTISVILMAATITVYRQLAFIQRTHLGFDKDHVINVKVRDVESWRGKTALLKQELLSIAGVEKAAASLNFMGDELDGSDVTLHGAPADAANLLAVTFVDEDFIETMQLRMAAGRPFSREFATDTAAAFIINEAAVKAFGWQSPEEAIGKELVYLGGERSKEPVIGVVKDFHFASLHQQVQPLLLMCWPSKLTSVSIKLQAGNPAQTLALIEQKWQKLSPDFPFEYAFADASIDQLYKKDQKTGQLFSLFAGLAIGIACLGLFGMTAFTTRQRTKEIGIRKVLGAEVSTIVVLLSKESIRLVLIATLIASPIAYYGMHKWLENFAYHIDIQITTYIISGTLALGIAVLTVSYQAIKAALANPVKSLRNE